MTIKSYPEYGQLNTFPLGFEGLQNGQAYFWAAIDNDLESSRFEDIQFQASIRSNETSAVSSGGVNVFLATSLDNVHWQGTYSGAEGIVTMSSAPNSHYLDTINVIAAATQYSSSVMSVLFGRNTSVGVVLPRYVAIGVLNSSGYALDVNAGNFWFGWQGVRRIQKMF